MEWPRIDIETGEFETVTTEQKVWQRAAEAALADITEDTTIIAPKIKAWKTKLQQCTNWATEFRELIEEFTSIMASATNEQALDMAQAGLDALHDMMLFRIDANTIVPAKDVFVLSSSFAKLETKTYHGTKPVDEEFQLGLESPQDYTRTLYGLEACAQVDAWYKYGCMETSASVLAKTTLAATNVPSLVHNKVFVLLGVTAELGPAKSLLQIPGVTVLGIARGNADDESGSYGSTRLKELIEYVQYESPDNTTLKVPEDGADLMMQGPQLASWILQNTKESQELILCPLAYLHNEANVRLCVAMDLIIQRVLRQRPTNATILSQYVSPATVMILPPTATSTAQKRLEQRPTWEGWANTLTFGHWMQPSTESIDNNNDYSIVNGIFTALGPQYVLAKTLQQWRCMVTYYREGHSVCCPFVPPTRTQSMLQSDAVAAALEGMHHFEPLVSFDVGPARSLLTAVLIGQLQLMNRPLPDMEENPFTIFWDGAVHGGIWTCPYSLDSISTINYVLGKTYYPKGYIPERALPNAPKPPTPEDGDKDEPVAEVRGPSMFDEDDDGPGSEFGKPMPECVRERLEFM